MKIQLKYFAGWWLAAAMGCCPALGQSSTGAQQWMFSGLRSSQDAGAFTAMARNAAGDLYLLMDQGDGVRVLEFDSTGTNVLAQAHLGAAGDIGYGLAIDSSSNVYVTGSANSGSISGSGGAAFQTSAGGGVNGFVARLDAGLNPVFVSFLGGSGISPQAIAVNGSAVYVTGVVIGSGLPVTPSAVVQAPPSGQNENGFVESFSADGTTLKYATYLGGVDGFTAPAAIAADAAGNVYVAGYTEATGYPTINALIAEMIPMVGAGDGSGFLTKIDAGGDTLVYSTFMSGNGITGLALNASATILYLAGNVAPNGFPVTQWTAPVTGLSYQSVVSMSAAGNSVNWVTAVAAGNTSVVTVDGNGNAWVAGQMSAPLLAAMPISPVGDGYAARVNAAGLVDHVVRMGGVAAEDTPNSSLQMSPAGVATDAAGDVYVAGSLQAATDSTLLSSVFYDMPLMGPVTAALPNEVRDMIPPDGSCGGNSSACAGSGGYLAEIGVSGGASLAVSTDTLPNLVVRNVGSVVAAGLTVSVSGYTYASNCGATLQPGADCAIALTGAGPGVLTLQSSSLSAPVTVNLAANTAGTVADALAISPRELDFGVVSAAGAGGTATVTVTNLTGSAQSFQSAVDALATRYGSPYTWEQAATSCTVVSGTTLMVGANASCTISLEFVASATVGNDAFETSEWSIGGRDVTLTAYSQAGAIGLSSTELNFGTYYAGGVALPRYLYIQNSSTTAVSHAAVSLPSSSPFTVTDGCPSVLAAGAICGLKVSYAAVTVPSADSTTLTLDDGLTVLVTGVTEQQPGTLGTNVNPFLSVSPTAVTFANPVVVTETSGSTQPVMVSNSGTSAFALGLAMTGDFSYTTNCGASLPGGASCAVNILFAPSQAGLRAGILTVTAGSSTPMIVNLSGTGTAITSASNGSVNFGDVPVGEPAVQWIAVTQGFSSLTATATAGYGVVLVEDEGFGHGSPSAAEYAASVTSACANCWLGIQFLPTAVGTVNGTVSLTSGSGGNANVLTTAGTGVSLNGAYFNPAAVDFGAVAVNSSSSGEFLTLTNGSTQTITLSAAIASANFTLLSTTCGSSLAAGDSCLVQVGFAPAATGTIAGTLSVVAGGTTVAAALTGFGNADPGVAFSPDALDFEILPGVNATSQTIAVRNTSGTSIQIGTPVVGTGYFSPTTNCGVLGPNAACGITVVFTPQSAAVTDVLTVPVTTINGTVSNSVPLTGGYTAGEAGIVVTPAEIDFGMQASGALGLTRLITVENMTANAMPLSVAMPRQFALAGAPCTTVAANGSCQFAVQFDPLTNGPITGSVVVTGTAGGNAVNSIAYMQGVGSGAGMLSFSNNVSGGLIDFGLVNSGQSSSQVVTITNVGAGVLNVRRVTAEWPFTSTSTCGTPLVVGASCTVTVVFSPLDEYAAGGSTPTPLSETGELIIESDAQSGPDEIDLSGEAGPAANASPNNTGASGSLSWSTGSLNFSTTMLGSVSAAQTVTLTNVGSAPVVIMGLGAGVGFTATDVNCIGTLAVNAVCSFDVVFAPAVYGLQFNSVEVFSNASTSLDFLSVSGEAQAAQLEVSPSGLSFGNVSLDYTAQQTVSVTNTGNTPVTMAGISASGDYSVSGACVATGSVIAANASCTVTVTFAPSATGTRTGMLSVASSATANPLTATLTGVGVQPQLNLSTTLLNFGSVQVGHTYTLEMALNNTGSTPVTGIVMSTGGDFSVASNCGTVIAVGSTCTADVSFVPTSYGTINGTLTIASSDPLSPGVVQLTGFGQQSGGFTLSVTPGAAADESEPMGVPGVYDLTAASVGGFEGTIAITCAPEQPVEYASCSILPGSVALNNNSVSTVVTINTLTSPGNSASTTAKNSGVGGRSKGVAMCVMLPSFVLLLLWRKRVRLPRLAAVLILLTAAMVGMQGCGGSNLEFTPPGTYNYLITAQAVGGAIPAQTVELQITVK